MLERLGIAVFFSSIALNFAWLGLTSPGWLGLPAALVAWYLADALSGLVHMYMDYRPCTAGVGLGELFSYKASRESPEYQAMHRAAMARIGFFERVVFDFKNHHPRPLALGRRSFYYKTRSIMIFLFPLSVLLNLFCYWWLPPGWLLIAIDVLLIGVIFTQHFHGTLHREDNPWIIHFMRRTKLLMTPAMHDIHHATLDCDFATINGWSNPAVNVVFRLLQRRGRMDPSGLVPR